MRYKPFDYQTYAKDFIFENKSAGLLLDMGMGKTVTTLTAVQELLDLGEVKRVLIVAPLRPAKETWPQEIAKWDHLDLTWALATGSAKDRTEALKKQAEITIINRENVVWLVDYYKKSWPFDMVVLDELSSFKSSQAARFKALKKVRPYIDRIVGLTGTPAPNGLLDLWPEMYLLDGGKALGKTITGYRQQYFIPSFINGHEVYTGRTRKGAAEEIYKKIEGLCISMKSEDYLKLPEVLYIDHEGDLPPKAREMYDRLEQDMLLPFKDGDIDAPSAAVLLGKLLQFSGGAVYDENGRPKALHEAKLEILDSLIEEANGQPILIYYAYRHEYDRLKARYKVAVNIKDEGAITSWNRGEIPILLAHPASAGHGLNLQDGGHIIIWYSLPVSLELYQQANKRLPRPGQKHTVLIHHILMRNTMDQHAMSILSSKETRQDALIEAVKARLKEL